MKNTLFSSKIFSAVFTLAYFIALMIWFFWYIFLGEDTKLNTVIEYIIFCIFTVLLFLCILGFVKINKGIVLKCIITIVNMFLLIMLFAGVVGSVSVSIRDYGLIWTRLTVLILHAIVLLYSTFRVVLTIKERIRLKNI